MQYRPTHLEKLFGVGLTQFVADVDDYYRFCLSHPIAVHYKNALRQLGLEFGPEVDAALDEAIAQHKKRWHPWDSLPRTKKKGVWV